VWWGAEGLLGRRCSHALLRHVALPVARAESAHAVAGAPSDCIPVLVQRAYVDLCGEFGDLRLAPANSEVLVPDLRSMIALAFLGSCSLHADALVVTDTRTAKNLPICYEPDTDGNVMSVPCAYAIRLRTRKCAASR